MSKFLSLLALVSLTTACDAGVEPTSGEDFSFRCGNTSEVGLIGLDKVVVAGTPSITGDAASIFSNHAVELAGNFEIEGDVISGGYISISGGNMPDGRVIPNAERISVDDPTADVQAAEANNDNASIPCIKKGNKCNGTVDTSGDLRLNSTQHLTLPSGVYFFHNITVNGQAKLHVSGDVTIYVDGAVTLNGGSSTNPTSDALTLISSGTSDIKLNGNADSEMAIFAPFAKVRFTGTQGFHGSALGRELHISGTADLEPMGDLTPVNDGECTGEPGGKVPAQPDRNSPKPGPVDTEE
jgi:hypothetical protein